MKEPKFEFAVLCLKHLYNIMAVELGELTEKEKENLSEIIKICRDIVNEYHWYEGK